jgi:quercetin dioxygenase-like cupin family protein
MKSWALTEIETPGGSRSPAVLLSGDEGRAVLIELEAGQELGQHQVKENMFLVVIDGSVYIEAAAESLDAGAGTLVAFEPDERRSVSSESGARVLLLFTPWPGAGHYRAEEKADAGSQARG